MTKETMLKVFGTGQITIPKEWRDYFNSANYKAVLNEEKREISIRPVETITLEETEWVSAKQLEQALAKAKLPAKFKKDLLSGYVKSDFYKNKK